MKRLIPLFFILITFISTVHAAWLSNVPILLKQVDGTEIQLYATGDEFYNWVHDENGFTIIRDDESGQLVYALLEQDALVSSGFVVGQVDPEALGLKPGLNISSQKMESIRLKALQFTAQMEAEAGFEKSTMDAEGAINNLVVYIRFADQNEFTVDTSLYLDMFNKDEVDYNSMYNYFQMISYQTLSLTSTAYPIPPTNIVLSYQDEHDRSYFQPYNEQTNPNGYVGNQRTDREHLLLKNAVDFISDEVPTSLDLDYDNNGNVDNVVFIVKGAPGAWADLLWPHRWSLFGEEAYINGKRVWDFNFQLESSLNSSGVGVLCHEMYHSLGAPDLYHYNQDNFTPVGKWDIMEQNTNPPQSMGAYMKFMYGGWIDEIPEITETGYYSLNPLENSENNIFKIMSPNHDWEYFVLEYRVKDGVFEAQIPGTGLIVYRINSLYEGQGNAQGPPDEVYLYRPSGTTTINGSTANAHFSLESGRTEINNETNPRLFLTNDEFGGIEISEVSSAGETISFFVNLPGEPEANFEADATLICPNQIVTFSDRSSGIPESYEWSFTPDDVTFVNGTDANSKNPQLTFNSEEPYSVSLLVDNEHGDSFISVEDYIQFESVVIPFFADFEDGSLSSQSFWVVNPDDEMTWKTMPVEGNGGFLAAGMQIRKYYEVGDRDALITPPLDFSDYENMDLQFEYAYAKYLQNYTDSLIVYVSADCGTNWDRVFAGGDDGNGSFATAPINDEEFIPLTSDDWCGHGYGASCITINLNEYLGNEKVRIKFESYSQLGNNLYLDHIMVAPNVAIANLDEKEQVFLQPNPASDYIILKNISQYNHIEILDIYGRIVLQFNNTKAAELKIDIHDLSNGVYILSFDHTQTQRLIVQ
ncbi:MAG: M6 family metalloprotease domain-containing protein [Bacteroidales bacterium]|nr:M6 family metalloprotease domain-containing protein [Bacteroidales bacterium]